MGHHGNKGPTQFTVIKQWSSIAHWVPVDMLEKGYGHRFGL